MIVWTFEDDNYLWFKSELKSVEPNSTPEAIDAALQRSFGMGDEDLEESKWDVAKDHTSRRTGNRVICMHSANPGTYECNAVILIPGPAGFTPNADVDGERYRRQRLEQVGGCHLV